MEPSLLLILIFILAPLIERLLKAGKKPPEPPSDQRPRMPLPQQRMPPRRMESPAEEPPPRVVVARREAEDEAAAAMLPDDLWEILTGERRAPRLPEPLPEEQAYDTEEEEVEAYSLEEEYALARREQAPVIIAPEPYIRPIPVREPPPIVSLEPVEIDDRKRHSAFHQRISRLDPAARVQRATPKGYRFTGSEDLRVAIIMSEILGKPKGLE